MKKSDVTKKKILEIAEEEFSSKGLYGARVDEIAERSGVNKRMLYAYFGNKEKLYLTVLEIVYSRLTECETQILEENSNSVEAVRNLILLYYNFLNENPSFVKLVMWENLNDAKNIEVSGAPMLKEPILKASESLIRRGIAEGVFRSDIDVEQTVMSLSMFCFSYFSNIHTMSLLMKTELSSEEQIGKRATHICDVLLKYLCK